MDVVTKGERLTQFDTESRAIRALILAKETDRKTELDVAEKAVILNSITVLNDEKRVLIAQRQEVALLPVIALVPAPAPGKNAPSRPRRQCHPSIREHATPPARCRVP